MSGAAPGLRECFDELVELAPREREAWFATHPLPAELHRELLDMLASDSREVPLLGSSAAALVKQYTPQDDEGMGLLGTCIGPYRLVDVLGQGGTSVVFRAQRASGSGTQTVALKLLRTGLFSSAGQRRFRREQGVLAQLSHRNIAGLIDGGVSEAGIPYIAMAFVQGVPITRHADAHALDVRARLALLVTTCRAIDAAHRALVVHCDLKPSNVLVDADGDVRILDFGIAHLLDDDAPDAARTTAIALTPGYAAPEQYQPGMVTTACDIHALGVLMGELLTGRLLPPDRTRMDVHHSDADPDAAQPTGLPRGKALAKLLRGDLEAICATARARDPQRRYLSAALLADDIERWLRNEPVLARPPSAGYRLRKTVQRHRAAAVATGIAALALGIGISTTLWQAHVAAEQAQRATAVRDFLIELFDASRAGQLPDRRLTLEQLVQRASTRLQAQSDLSTATRIEMLRTLGEVGAAASDYEQANQLYHQALVLAEGTLEADDPAVTRIRLLQARLLTLQSRYADASRAYEILLPQMREAGDAAGVEGLQNYASALMFSAQTDLALAISAEAAQRAALLYPAGSRSAVHASLTRANQLVGGGRLAEAEPLLDAALRTWRGSGQAPQDDVLQGLTDLSRIRGAQDRLDEAEPLLTRASAMMKAIYGEDHVRVANSLGSLGDLELRRHRLEPAARYIDASLTWCDRPGRHPTRSCIELEFNKARLAFALGDLDQADARSAHALSMTQAIFRDGHRWIAHLGQLRAGLSLRRGDPAAALGACDDARQLLARLGESDGLVALAVLARRAEVLLALGRFEEADADIRQALVLWERLAPAGTLTRVDLLGTLVSIQAGLGDRAAARATADSALALVHDRSLFDPARLARIEALARDAQHVRTP